MNSCLRKLNGFSFNKAQPISVHKLPILLETAMKSVNWKKVAGQLKPHKIKKITSFLLLQPTTVWRKLKQRREKKKKQWPFQYVLLPMD